MSDIPTLVSMVDDVSGEVQSVARSMAALMADPRSRSADQRPVSISRRLGQVSAVTNLPFLAPTADVLVNGTTIAGCSPQSTYRPMVGDLVWVELQGPDPQLSPPLTTYANRAWNALTLNSPWVTMADNGWTLGPAYWRDAAGMVHLRGSVKNGADNTVIGTLPANYRPPGHVGFAVYTLDGASTAGLGRVAVFSNGNLLYLGPSAPDHVALDGIHFRID